MNLKKLLSNQSHWTINKHLAKEIGLESTLILQHLIDYSKYHNKETIFQTYKQIASALNLSEYAIKNGIPKLKELGFISTERKGMGYKNHYTVHGNCIWGFLTQPASEGEITPASEVSTKSPLSEGENTLSSEGEINLSSEGEINLSSEGEINLSSEGENTLAINKNIINKNIINKNIIKKEDNNNSTTGNKNIIEKSIIDILLSSDASIKDYNNAIEEFKELGGINSISEIMEWDDSVKENYYRQIKNVNSIRTHE